MLLASDQLRTIVVAEKKRTPQPGTQRFPRLLDWRSHSQDGVYWLCGIAARQAASNAVTHWATSAGSRVSS